MALHITQILNGIVSEFLFKGCFCIFFLEGFSGPDMPSSSVEYNQLRFPCQGEYKNLFVVQSALFGWFRNLPSAKAPTRLGVNLNVWLIN